MLHCDVHRRRKVVYRGATKRDGLSGRSLLWSKRELASPGRVEFMNRLVEIRRQEYFCRERALHDSERKLFWLAEAEEWEQRALDEIAFHFRECNLEAPDHSLKKH